MTDDPRFVEVDGVQYKRARAVALGLIPDHDAALEQPDGETAPPASRALEHGAEAPATDGASSLVTSDALRVPPVGRGRGRTAPAAPKGT